MEFLETKPCEYCRVPYGLRDRVSRTGVAYKERPAEWARSRTCCTDCKHGLARREARERAEEAARQAEEARKAEVVTDAWLYGRQA